MGAWPRQRPLACCNPCSLAGRSCGGATTTALARHCARRDRDSRPLGGESPRLIGAESSVVALSWRYRGSIVAPCALVVTLPPPAAAPNLGGCRVVISRQSQQTKLASYTQT